MTRLLCLPMILLAAVSAGANDLAGPEVLIPIVGRGPGAHGSEWRTDLAVTHVARRQIEEPTPVALTLSMAGHPDRQALYVLGPTESVAIADVLLTAFGISEGSGLLRVTASAPAARVAARARIYNVRAEGGDYGQIVYGRPTTKLGTVQLLPALHHAPGRRTNLGVANPSEASLMLFVTIHAEDGQERRGFTTVVAPRSVWRWNDVFGTSGISDLAAATIRLTASQPYYSFASVVNEEPGDADFVSAVDVPTDAP